MHAIHAVQWAYTVIMIWYQRAEICLCSQKLESLSLYDAFSFRRFSLVSFQSYAIKKSLSIEIGQFGLFLCYWVSFGSFPVFTSIDRHSNWQRLVLQVYCCWSDKIRKYVWNLRLQYHSSIRLKRNPNSSLWGRFYNFSVMLWWSTILKRH